MEESFRHSVESLSIAADGPEDFENASVMHATVSDEISDAGIAEPPKDGMDPHFFYYLKKHRARYAKRAQLDLNLTV